MSYPTLRLGVLQGIVELKAACDAKPGYLRSAECPYDNDTISILERLFKPVEVEVIKEVIVDKPEAKKRGRPSGKKALTDAETSEVEREASEMLKELRQMAKTEAGEMKQMDTSTKLSIIKTRTTLLEKLVTIRERFTSARQVQSFMHTVMELLEDLVPEERRGEMLDRLEPYR
jgi:erythromycin esterase-like protein